MSVQLFGIGETALNRFLAPCIHPLANVGESACVDSVLRITPNVAGDNFGGIGTVGALGSTGAGLTIGFIGTVFAVAQAVGVGILDDLSFGASVGVGN